MTTTPHTTESTRQDEHTNDTGSAAVDLATHVDLIEASMATITDILTTPTAELFHTHRTDIIRLLTTISHTDTLYAAFAYAAHEAGVSRAAGTTRTSTYLARLLDTSEYQARQWINLGISLYKPPEPPKDNTDGDDDDTDDAQSRADQLAERRRAHEAHQAHLAAQAQARKQARKLSDAKLAEINRELEHLHPSLHDEHHHILFDNATAMATTTTVEDLKLHLRTQVRTLNSTVVDPTADYRARKLVWSPADTHGNVRVTAVLPRTGHALLETLMSPARLAAFDRSRGVNTDEDRRTMPQRRADVFMAMLETWAEDADAATAPRTRGLASLVVALSAKDLTTLPIDTGSAPGSINAGADAACAAATNTGSAASANDADTGSPPPVSGESLNTPSVWFPTNTNARLHPIDILRLGLAEHDLGVILDPDSGRALASARMKRHATVEQKLMLVAEQLCCAYPGCNRAAVDCDVHHIKAWSHGGRTTIDNLTLLCRTHHRMNRDQHDGGVGMGHAEVDPDSGRVGWREARHNHEGLPDLPGAPPPTTPTGTDPSPPGSPSTEPSGSGPRVRPRPHPRLSDTVVVNTSTTASQAPGAKVPEQDWGSTEVQALFDPPQPPTRHSDRAS
ncbi:HNH endonuclease signature motif containing protein [Corynebacterium falsenii]|uniref:HNH endonuclease signature motif containing protein n=1 Tax=Corynebacterium falsenii TaxID=108486 RepID=UPI003FD3F9BC